MRWADNFIAVDWGTTNRRAYRIDQSGACHAMFEDDCGIMSVAAGEFPAAAQAIRERLGDLPLLLAGMVGSNRGWVEVPYVRCPATHDDLVGAVRLVDDGRGAIIPGLSVEGSGKADVMRGEEVQVFGALESKAIPPTCLVGHPGTHNKWVSVEDGRILGFRTVMTGEVFNLLRANGILAVLLTGEAVPGELFNDGVRCSLAGGPLTADLFSARARVLLGDMAGADASSYVSGLLIGADIGLGQTLATEAETIIMGRPDLTRLYAAAAIVAGMAAREVDGSSAFVAGAVAIARKLA